VPTTERPEMHPGRTADIYVGETLIGFIGQIHPLTAKAYKINETFAFELNMDAIFALAKVKDGYQVVSRFPAVSRDLAILVDRQVAAADLKAAIVTAGGSLLHDVEIFDVYIGANVSDDKKSLAYALTFVDVEKTLVDEEINAAIARITTALAAQFNAEIR